MEMGELLGRGDNLKMVQAPRRSSMVIQLINHSFGLGQYDYSAYFFR